MTVALSPVERRGELWFKREDLVGGKGRRLRFMLEEYAVAVSGPRGLVVATPAASSIPAYVAKEGQRRGWPVLVAVGMNTGEAALRVEPLQVAKALGAELVIAGAGQHSWRREQMRRTLLKRHPTYFNVPPGINPVRQDPRWLRRFYLCSAGQVMNLPEELEVLIIRAEVGTRRRPSFWAWRSIVPVAYRSRSCLG